MESPDVDVVLDLFWFSTATERDDLDYSRCISFERLVGSRGAFRHLVKTEVLRGEWIGFS